MTTAMNEGVARAICAARGLDPDAEEGHNWQHFVGEAKVFIAAAEALADAVEGAGAAKGGNAKKEGADE